MLCKYCEKEFTPSKGFVNFCSVACKNPKNRPGGTSWNKGLKGRQEWHNTEGLKLGHDYWTGKKRPDWSERMKEDNPIHKWAKRDPEGFRKEQSRKTTISNYKSPRGGWIGGYTGFTGKDKTWVEYNGVEVTQEFFNAMNKE